MGKVSKRPSRQLTDSSRLRHILPAKLGSHLNFPATDPTRAVRLVPPNSVPPNVQVEVRARSARDSQKRRSTPPTLLHTAATHGIFVDLNSGFRRDIVRERDLIECKQRRRSRPLEANFCINPLALYYASTDAAVITQYRRYHKRYPLDEDIARRERDGRDKQALANMVRPRKEAKPAPFTLDREKDIIWPNHEDLFHPVRNPAVADSKIPDCDVTLWSDNVKGVLPGTPRGSTHEPRQYKLLEDRYKYHLQRVRRLLNDEKVFDSFIEASKDQGFDPPTAVALLSEMEPWRPVGGPARRSSGPA